jgi:hypothetical protein
MNFTRSLALIVPILAFAACSKQEVAAPATTAASVARGTLVPIASIADTAWVAAAQAAYPLTTCIISTDTLGGMMGPVQDYVYRVEGEPDRLVRFCCKDCLPDFMRNADALMAQIASGTAAAPAMPAAMNHDAH